MYPANPVKLRPGRMAFCSIRKQEKHMCLFFVSCLFLPRKAINSFFILAFKERFTFLTFNARKYARFFRIILLQNSNAFVFYRLKSIFLGRKLYRKIEGVVKARFSESKKLAAVQVWHHFKIKIKKKIWWNVFWFDFIQIYPWYTFCWDILHLFGSKFLRFRYLKNVSVN